MPEMPIEYRHIKDEDFEEIARVEERLAPEQAAEEDREENGGENQDGGYRPLQAPSPGPP